MGYYQEIVSEYLRADRATFINPEFCLQLNGAEKEPIKGSSWYVDLVAINLKERTTFLCEVSYSQTLSALLKRLHSWSEHWTGIVAALNRDTGTTLPDWEVRPWIFIPEVLVTRFVEKAPKLPVVPRITTLEMTQPWQYCTWDRRGEANKPASIPSVNRT
jgi:hypothetical protein